MEKAAAAYTKPLPPQQVITSSSSSAWIYCYIGPGEESALTNLTTSFKGASICALLSFVLLIKASLFPSKGE